jgi:hypothetical protein
VDSESLEVINFRIPTDFRARAKEIWKRIQGRSVTKVYEAAAHRYIYERGLEVVEAEDRKRKEEN